MKRLLILKILGAILLLLSLKLNFRITNFIMSRQLAFKVARNKTENRKFLARELTNFEEVHVAQVCYNGEAIRRLSVFVKSLLYYRTCPVTLHILTNFQTNITIHEFFRTWELAYFKIQTYVREDYEQGLHWIWYAHRAGPYAVKKLIIENILPIELEKVIFYDADVVMLSDIRELWKLFEKWNSTQLLGMAYETQTWYGNHSVEKTIWPSIDWGFNSGLILYHLGKLRRANWEQIWKPVAERELKRRGFAMLPEQDILNACFYDHPEILYKIPCVWNMQFGERLNPDICPFEYKFKALHTTPTKIEETPPDILISLSMYDSVVDFFTTVDGSLFTQKSKSTHRVMPYCHDNGLSRIINSGDVTLVLYLAYSEREQLNDVMEYWAGPMSIAIFGDEKDFSSVDSLPQNGMMAYHFVFKKHVQTVFPAKLLHDVAVMYVLTSHLMLGDPNFVVNRATYETLAKMAKAQLPRVALPVFESKCYFLPDLGAKGDALDEISLGNIQSYQQSELSLNEKWQISTSDFITTWNSERTLFVMIFTAEHPINTQKSIANEYEDVNAEEGYLWGTETLVPANHFAVKIPFLEDVLYRGNSEVQCM